jgi:hypothetical protein
MFTKTGCFGVVSFKNRVIIEGPQAFPRRRPGGDHKEPTLRIPGIFKFKNASHKEAF